MPRWAINTFSRSGSSTSLRLPFSAPSPAGLFFLRRLRPVNPLENNGIDVDNAVNKKLKKFVFYLFMQYLCRSYGSMPKRAYGCMARFEYLFNV